MASIAAFAFIAVLVFTSLLLLAVEAWTSRLLLAGLVAAVWWFFGLLGAMIAAAFLSIVVLIASKAPHISKA